MKKLILLVAAHKADPNTRVGGAYLPVQAGKALHPDLDLGYQNDNEGDNISSRNASWNELTVLYWGWKNLKDVKYLGLNHYRRYFKGVTEENIDSLMQGYDMIAVKQSEYMLSNHERPANLINVTTCEDYYIFADTFLSIHPEFKKEFIKYFYNSRDSYPFQMFIATKELYDKYCEFMFPVLFEVEKVMKPHGYSRQNRAIGYMGEWFLGLFITCYHLKVNAIPIDNFSSAPLSLAHRIRHFIAQSVRRNLTKLLDLTYKVPSDIKVPGPVAVGFKNDGIKLKALKTKD